MHFLLSEINNRHDYKNHKLSEWLKDISWDFLEINEKQYYCKGSSFLIGRFEEKIL